MRAFCASILFIASANTGAECLAYLIRRWMPAPATLMGGQEKVAAVAMEAWCSERAP